MSSCKVVIRYCIIYISESYTYLSRANVRLIIYLSLTSCSGVSSSWHLSRRKFHRQRSALNTKCVLVIGLPLVDLNKARIVTPYEQCHAFPNFLQCHAAIGQGGAKLMRITLSRRNPADPFRRDTMRLYSSDGLSSLHPTIYWEGTIQGRRNICCHEESHKLECSRWSHVRWIKAGTYAAGNVIAVDVCSRITYLPLEICSGRGPVSKDYINYVQNCGDVLSDTHASRKGRFG